MPPSLPGKRVLVEAVEQQTYDVDVQRRVGGLSPEQAVYQRLSGQTNMVSHVAQDAGQGTNAKTRVPRNRDVVLAAFEGGQPKMATCLTVTR